MSSSSSSSSSSSTDSFLQNFTVEIYPEFYPQFNQQFNDGGSSSNYKVMEKQFIQNLPSMIEQSMQYEERSKKPQKEKKKRAYIHRSRVQRGVQLYDDYFAPRATYANQFRRRFRMRRELFDKVMTGVMETDTYFHNNVNAAGTPSLTPYQKFTAVMKMIAYGLCADGVDEYWTMGESTAIKCLNRFCIAVVQRFGPEYMRKPTENDLRRLLAINASRGFSGMIVSVDCMHWEWKNCPKTWAGQFQGRSGKPTLILEAVTSQDTWIWHSFFGLSGKFNDKTVLERSHLFDDLLNGVSPDVRFHINGRDYNMPYYLVDGIYPSWATFVPVVPNPTTHKLQKFSTRQESCRKDVERAFGVIQARFHIIKHPAFPHSRLQLQQIMDCCIVLHNMILEDERDNYLNYDQAIEDWLKECAEGNLHYNADILRDVTIKTRPSVLNDFVDYRKNQRMMESYIQHDALKHDLIEHIWRMRL